MDDRALTGAGQALDHAEREAAGSWARPASLLLIGLLAGLAIGWVWWHEGNAGRTAIAAAPVSVEKTVVEGVDVTADPILGPDDAPVTIVEFSDFQCPFCRRFAIETAPRLRRQYGDQVRWIFVNLPLQSIHPDAYEAALAGECAHREGKFWEWYDAMFSQRFSLSATGLTQAALSIGLDADGFQSCLRNADYATEVAADLKEAQKFYILGTPTFFINGRRLEGAHPLETFARVIDEELAGS